MIHIFFIFLVNFSALAQESEIVGQNTIETESYRTNRFQLRLELDSFKKRSFGTSGMKYGAEVGYLAVGEYEVFGGGALLYGQSYSKSVQEFSNPYLGSRFNLYLDVDFQIWASAVQSFARNDAVIAARHNTLKPGLEMRYSMGRMFGHFGVDYHWRYSEADSSVDVKDIYSFNLGVGRRLTRKINVEGEVLWYRALGVKTKDFVLAREADWAGVGPTLKYNFVSGVSLKTSLMFPVHSTRDPNETEVAVWDASLPKVRDVTWRTDVGMQF